jgi:hypothetical protein
VEGEKMIFLQSNFSILISLLCSPKDQNEPLQPFCNFLARTFKTDESFGKKVLKGLNKI